MTDKHTYEVRELPAHAATTGPNHHFFGYYDMLQWDATGRYILGLETTFMDRSPQPEDPAIVGLIDIENNCRWEPLAETHAWNWQQSSRLQWLATAPDREIIFNDRTPDGFVAVIMDIQTGKKRILPRAVNIVSHDGKSALTLNFSRVHRFRPGYGYPGMADPSISDPAPADDGVFWMDLATGESRLIISFHDILALPPKRADWAGASHWVNHLAIATDDQRASLLHRWTLPKGRWWTRLITANMDGSDIYLLNDYNLVSHFDWRDSNHILAYAAGPTGDYDFYVHTDQSTEMQPLGDMMPDDDGHCSYSPDRRWVLNDTYPDEQGQRTLMLYDIANDRRIDLGTFYSPAVQPDELRCDLHPRWNRTGTQICFDSVHEGSRQIYLMDVEPIVAEE